MLPSRRQIFVVCCLREIYFHNNIINIFVTILFITDIDDSV